MNKRDTLFVVAGFVAGAASAALAFYFGVYRKYVPLKDIEKEVNDLEQKKLDLRDQVKNRLDIYDQNKKETDSAIKDREKELDFYDDQIIAVKHEWDALRPTDPVKAKQHDLKWDNLLHHGYKLTLADLMPQPDHISGTINKPVISKNPSESDQKDDISDLDNDKIDGIYDGNPRWDGPFDKDEQKEYDAAEGDGLMQQSAIARIKRQRYKDSMDIDHFKYRISESEHEKMPFFFDTESLDFYEDDHILARGIEMVTDADDLIDTDILDDFDDKTNILWCRNEELETDYELVRHKGSYQHDVIGIPEDEMMHDDKQDR